MTREHIPVRFGVFGYGFVAGAHCQALAATKGAEVIAVCGPPAPAAQEFADRFGIGLVTTDAPRLLDAVDAVIVATPDDAHHELVLAAAAAGKHIFCEKPLGMDLAQATEMVAATERAGVRAMTGFLLRYTPIVAQLAQRIQAGEFGRLVSFHAERYNTRMLQPGVGMTWRYDPRRSAAGVLSDLGSHMFDVARLFAGPVTDVAASLRTVVPEVADPAGGAPLPVTVDDDCVIALRFASGCHGSIAVSRAGLLDSHQPLGRAAVQVNGTAASVTTDALEHATISRLGQAAEPLAPNLGPGADDHAGVLAAMGRRMLAAFVEAIRTGEDRAPTLRDGWHAQALIEAVRRAAVSGRWERVPAGP